MILTPQQARAAVSGRKTQQRFPVNGRPCALKVGHDYAVRPGAKRASIGRIEITAVRQEHLGAVTYQDARAEGHRMTAAFKIAWVRRYDRAWIKRELVDLAEVFDDACSVVDWILVKRFDEAHAHRRVHVVCFKVATDRPLLLATQMDVLSGRCETGEYTHSASRAIDQLEVLPIDALYTQKAAEEGDRSRARFRRDLEAERARRNGVSTGGLSNRALRHINGAVERD